MLDSGCINHMTGERNMFTSFEKNECESDCITSSKRVCDISHIRNIFQADFSFAQSSLRCLISQSSFELWKWHRRLGHLSFDLLCRLSGLGLL
jgi:hypothetical protein